MSHIQRRCPRCRLAVPRGRKACPACKSTTFTYRVRYIDPDGREKSQSFKRRADADDFLTEVTHTVRASAYVDPAAGRQTVRAYLEEWRAVQSHHRPKTAASTRTRFRTMVYPYLGDVPIGKLSPSRVAKWQAQLVAAGYATRTIVGVRGVVAGAFNDAVRDRRLATNPFTGVKAPKPDERKVVPRTIAQVEVGRAAVPNDRYRAVIRVDAGSGLRWAELFGLTVDRVDFLRREITVDRQLVGRVGPVPVFGPPKTPKSNRVVPVGDVVVRELAAHLKKFPAEPGDLIFRTARGTPLTRGVWQRAWIPAREAMGLQPGEGLHHLRHFYASLLIADGRSVIEVQERLGHATAQETLDTYGHLFEDAADGTRHAVDSAFAALDDDAGEAGADDRD